MTGLVDVRALVVALAALPDDDLRPLVERIAPMVAPPPTPERPMRRSPLATIPEVAEYLNCPRQRVDDLLHRGRLTRVKDGGRTLIRWEEVDAHLANRRGGPVGAALPPRGRVH